MTEELIERLIEGLDEQKKLNKNLLETNQGLYNLVRGLQSTLESSLGANGKFAYYSEKVSVMADKVAKMHIPAEVKAIVEHRHVVDTSGKAFLVACGLFFLIGLGLTGYNAIRMGEIDRIHQQAKKQELDQKQVEWLIDFHNYQKEKNPNDTKNFHAQKPYPK